MQRACKRCPGTGQGGEMLLRILPDQENSMRSNSGQTTDLEGPISLQSPWCATNCCIEANLTGGSLRDNGLIVEAMRLLNLEESDAWEPPKIWSEEGSEAWGWISDATWKQLCVTRTTEPFRICQIDIATPKRGWRFVVNKRFQPLGWLELS